MSIDMWEWERIVLPRGSISPSPCYLMGVLLHEDRLCTFGGVCNDPGRNHSGKGSYYDPFISENVVYEYGWTNQYHEFDVSSSEFYSQRNVLIRLVNMCTVLVGKCILYCKLIAMHKMRI